MAPFKTLFLAVMTNLTASAVEAQPHVPAQSAPDLAMNMMVVSTPAMIPAKSKDSAETVVPRNVRYSERARKNIDAMHLAAEQKARKIFVTDSLAKRKKFPNLIPINELSKAPGGFYMSVDDGKRSVYLVYTSWSMTMPGKKSNAGIKIQDNAISISKPSEPDSMLVEYDGKTYYYTGEEFQVDKQGLNRTHHIGKSALVELVTQPITTPLVAIKPKGLL